MAVTFRGAGSAVFAANNVANPTALTPTKSGTVDGDLMLCFTWARSITATVSTPTGWGVLTGFPVTSGTASGGRIYVFSRTADSTANDAPTITWTGLTTGTSGDACGAAILSWQDASLVQDGTVASTDLSAQTNTSTIPAITTAIDHSFVVGFAIKLNESSGQTSTTATFTERLDAQTTSGTGHAVTISDKLDQTPAGSSGTAAVTWSITTSARALVATVAFRVTSSFSVPDVAMAQPSPGAYGV